MESGLGEQTALGPPSNGGIPVIPEHTIAALIAWGLKIRSRETLVPGLLRYYIDFLALEEALHVFGKQVGYDFHDTKTYTKHHREKTERDRQAAHRAKCDRLKQRLEQAPNDSQRARGDIYCVSCTACDRNRRLQMALYRRTYTGTGPAGVVRLVATAVCKCSLEETHCLGCIVKLDFPKGFTIPTELTEATLQSQSQATRFVGPSESSPYWSVYNPSSTMAPQVDTWTQGDGVHGYGAEEKAPSWPATGQTAYPAAVPPPFTVPYASTTPPQFHRVVAPPDSLDVASHYARPTESQLQASSTAYPFEPHDPTRTRFVPRGDVSLSNFGVTGHHNSVVVNVMQCNCHGKKP